MSFEPIEVIQCEEEKESRQTVAKRSKKLHRCLEICLNLKDRKILVAAHGALVFCLGVVLAVGHFAIKATTTSTVHTESSVPIAVTSAVVIVNGLLFNSLLFNKHRYLIITVIILSTASGILSAVSALHYGITVSDRLTALSDCMYTSVTRLCTCTVVTSSSRTTYNFENTVSCSIITKHLREVAYGMCGVYTVTFVSCFGAAVSAILLAHVVEIKKIKDGLQQEYVPSDKEKQPFEEFSADILPTKSEKCGLTWQHDVATQTKTRTTGNDANCRRQCRHFVEVTVPDTNNDFVVNITKSRDPPPPYCETVYT